eukprot:gene12093-13339_t
MHSNPSGAQEESEPCTRGFVPGLFGVSHGAIQFMAYEELKKVNSRYTGKSVAVKQVGTQQYAAKDALTYIVMAATSKVVAVVTTYPYQVLRSRLQDQDSIKNYNGVVECYIKKL